MRLCECRDCDAEVIAECCRKVARYLWIFMQKCKFIVLAFLVAGWRENRSYWKHVGSERFLSRFTFWAPVSRWQCRRVAILAECLGLHFSIRFVINFLLSRNVLLSIFGGLLTSKREGLIRDHSIWQKVIIHRSESSNLLLARKMFATVTGLRWLRMNKVEELWASTIYIHMQLAHSS